MAGFSGSFPHDLLDLNDWRWQGPVKDDGSLGKEGDGKAVSVPDDVADTEKMEKFVDDPWFMLVSEGAGAPYVRLRSPAKGSTTRSSSTTRSELREMHHPDGQRESAWDAAGSEVHNLKVRLAVTKVMEKNGKRSRVAVAQVHKTSEDGILVYLDGQSRQLKWKQDSQVQDGSLGAYTLGEYVNIGLSVRDGKCTIYVNDVAKAEGKLTGSRRRPATSRPAATTRTTTATTATPRSRSTRCTSPRSRCSTTCRGRPAATSRSGRAWRRNRREMNRRTRRTTQPQIVGNKPRDLIQFNGPKQAWKLNLDINDAGDHPGSGGSVEKSAKALAEGFVHPGHFEVVEDGTAVRFRSHLNGATTGSSKNPRTELREMKPGDPTEKAEWNTAEGNVRGGSRRG